LDLFRVALTVPGVILALMGSTTTLTVADEASSYAAIEPSVALVISAEGKQVAFGTAFCIESADGYGFLLTNRHVIGIDRHPGVVLMNDVRHVHVSSVVRIATIDAAVLAIKSACAPLPISNTLPSVGTRVALAGFPAFQIEMLKRGLGLAPSFHEGTVSSIIANGALIEYDAQTDRGNSGSPLFDVESGNIYGMVTLVDTGTTGALQNNIAIGATSLEPFLQNARHDIAVGLKELGTSSVSVRPVTTRPSSASASTPGPPAETRQLNFGEALTRLIADAPSQFTADRYAEVHDSNVRMSSYSMTFGIIGYTDCSVDVWDDTKTRPSAGCVLYKGTKAGEARSAYLSAKASLAAFAQAAGSTVTEKASGHEPFGELVTTYEPGNGATVALTLELDLGIVILSVDAP
jgi:S1-C subfamily serine protease